MLAKPFFVNDVPTAQLTLFNNLPLTGLKVLELHAIGPVPFAGMLLQSLGADVTRIAPPNDPGLGLSIAPQFDLLNIGKTTVTIDLKSDLGKQALNKVLHDCDVLLEGFRPGVLERLGLAPSQLLLDHPHLVIGRLSGWGDQGALAQRAGHDINYLALSGALLAIGPADQPVPPLNLVADFGGGAMHLLVGVLAKLVQRGLHADRLGGTVTTSILAGTHGLMPMFHGLVAAGLHHLQRAENLLDGGAPFYTVYKTLDERFVAVGALEPKFYAQLLAVMKLSDQLSLRDQYNPSSWPATRTLFTQTFLLKSRDEWAVLGANVDCCLSPVLNLVEARQHPQNVANAWFGATDALGPEKLLLFT